MKLTTRILIAAVVMLAGAAWAQTSTVRWALVPLEARATTVSTHTTQASCDTAARAANRTRVYTCERRVDVVAAIVVPPTCTAPRPVTETRSQACPTGSTGTWTQTRGYTATGYPTCWTADAWAPAAAPPGACTPIVTPPPPPPPAGETTAVNAALVPTGFIGTSSYSTRRIATTGEQPGPDAGGIGAARAICAPSHFNFDDPLVYPGQPGRSHLHVFFGNTGTNASTTPANLLTSGNGTCRGGIINRSAYWAPAMIDTGTGAPIRPNPSNDENFVYYKTGYFGVRDADVKPIPPLFRMIAGDSKSRVPQQRVTSFECYGGPSGERYTIPSDCPQGATLRMSVTFPQCWNGLHVESTDHKSHVAYPTEGRGCDDVRFPIALPEISMQINYPVTTLGGTRNWRLSSDINGTPAGSSGHADFMNGWEQDILNTWVTRVINPGFSASGGIGDGRALY